MRENSRVRSERFALSLDTGQVTVVVLGALVLLGGAFALGMTAGHQAAAARAAPSATRAALERLDEPLTTREEPPPELKATQALTDARSIEKLIPVAVKAKPSPRPIAPRTASAAPTSTSTSTPTPTPTSTSTSTSTGSAQHLKAAYTIQIASSTTRGDAERIVRQLSGRQASIVVADVPGKGRRYRVQVGSYPSQEAAKRQLPQLSREGLHGIVTALR